MARHHHRRSANYSEDGMSLRAMAVFLSIVVIVLSVFYLYAAATPSRILVVSPPSGPGQSQP